MDQNERLVICGDFNLPGGDEVSIDGRLSSLLDVHGYHQHVTEPTRHDAYRGTDNLLDLVITTASRTPQLVSDVRVHSSYGLSDHSVIVFELSVRRHKPAVVHYTYRNIKQIDAVEFERQLLVSDIVTDPPDTPDEFVDRLETTVIGILNNLAPMRSGMRPHSKKSARWLSEEAIAAKRLRR